MTIGPDPDSPRGIPLLRDGDGKVSSPTGMQTGKIISGRINRDEDGKAFSIPVPHGDTLNLYVMMFSCTS